MPMTAPLGRVMSVIFQVCGCSDGLAVGCRGYGAVVKVLVRLMGAFSVEVDGRIVDQDRFQRRSAAAVVKLLALAPSHRMHREQVIDALWPALPVHEAANQLHKAAHYARRATDAMDCVTVRNDMVTLFGTRTVIVNFPPSPDTRGLGSTAVI